MTTSVAPYVRQITRTHLLASAATAGVALGVLDLMLQISLPYPYANLANSSAVWALAACGFAAWARTTPGRAAVAGVVLLTVAVEAYYGAAVLADRAAPASLLDPRALAWVVFGVLAGAVFGVAGTWVTSSEPWLASAGLAAAAAVFFAEVGARVVPGSGSGLADAGTTLLTFGAGMAVLSTASARPAHLLRAAVLVVPLTILGVMAFTTFRI